MASSQTEGGEEKRVPFFHKAMETSSAVCEQMALQLTPWPGQAACEQQSCTEAREKPERWDEHVAAMQSRTSFTKVSLQVKSSTRRDVNLRSRSSSFPPQTSQAPAEQWFCPIIFVYCLTLGEVYTETQ